MQANALWQRPQTGGEDQFFTQCATDIHKIRPQKREREGGQKKVGGRKGKAEVGIRKMASWCNDGREFEERVSRKKGEWEGE